MSNNTIKCPYCKNDNFKKDNFITEITYQDLVVIKMEHSIVQPSFSISDRYQPDIVTIITYDKNIKKGTNNESK